MDATRSRFGALLEWVLAAIVLMAMLVVGSSFFGEFRRVSAITPVIANSSAQALAPATSAPAGLPAASVSVPVLLLPDGQSIKLGDAAAAVSAKLASGTETVSPLRERGRHGDRITRFYDFEGSRFSLVFEPFEENAELRVAAIFMN